MLRGFIAYTFLNRSAWVLLFFFFFIGFHSFSQTPRGSTSLDEGKIYNRTQVNLRILQDSLKLGEQLLVSLSATHPNEVQLLFPDSSFSYEPFELIKKVWFPTISDSLSSKDSAVFYLRTFKPAGAFVLSLPVFVVSDKDSLEVYSNPDTVTFVSLLAKEPFSGLKENDDLASVSDKVNYPMALVLALFIFLLLSILVFVFGKPIQKQFRLFLLLRRQRIFNTLFDRLSKQANKEKSVAKTEETILLWKRHLERLSGINFSTFTSREIVKTLNDEALEISLKNLDRAIYGGAQEAIDEALFPILKAYSDKFYQERKEEIKSA